MGVLGYPISDREPDRWTTMFIPQNIINSTLIISLGLLNMDGLTMLNPYIVGFQCIGLRENLQETIHFPMKNGGFL